MQDLSPAEEFQAKTTGLTALTARFEALQTEQRELARLFGDVGMQIHEALERGEPPLQLVGKLFETHHALTALEEKIATEMALAIEALR